jgi:hypothetical protein
MGTSYDRKIKKQIDKETDELEFRCRHEPHLIEVVHMRESPARQKGRLYLNHTEEGEMPTGQEFNFLFRWARD